VAAAGRELLAARLRELPALAGREVLVCDLALGGYKQPQQLLTVAWLQSLGARLDAVVNVDGFNEVALAPAELPRDLFPFYPRGWVARVRNLVEPGTLRLVAEMDRLERAQRRWARVVSIAPLRWSLTANLVWRLQQRRLVAAHAAAAGDLERRAVAATDELPYRAAGPGFPALPDDAYFDELVRTWRDASLALDHLCRGAGTVYVHALQPNQYVPDSKRLTREERRQAYQEDHPYRTGVLEGYPRLRAAGAELAEAGVRFVDLTDVFADVDQTVYTDTCCHVNEAGYRRVAERIANVLVSELESLAARPGGGGDPRRP
jgi:hypothetical protein